MALSLVDLSCGYNGKPVLDNIHCTIEPGECVCLLGPNGIGKTTLFKTVLGLLTAVRGDVLVDNIRLNTLSSKKRARSMAYVPQHCEVFFPYSVLDMVVMGRTASLSFGYSPSKEDYRQARSSLEQLSIGSLADNLFNRLSGGEKQLVLIARALCQQAVYLVLDEPTSSLDFGNQSLVLSVIRQLARNGLGIFMTTHYPNHALLCASKVILINKEKEISIGPPEEVITSDNLRKAYGVETLITGENARPGETIRYCVPLMQS